MSKLEERVKALESGFAGHERDLNDDSTRLLVTASRINRLEGRCEELAHRLDLLERWQGKAEDRLETPPGHPQRVEPSSPSQASGAMIDANELLRRLKMGHSSAMLQSPNEYWDNAIEQCIETVEAMVREGQGEEGL